jgi:hypothetical protein
MEMSSCTILAQPSLHKVRNHTAVVVVAESCSGAQPSAVPAPVPGVELPPMVVPARTTKIWPAWVAKPASATRDGAAGMNVSMAYAADGGAGTGAGGLNAGAVYAIEDTP